MSKRAKLFFVCMFAAVVLATVVSCDFGTNDKTNQGTTLSGSDSESTTIPEEIRNPGGYASKYSVILDRYYDALNEKWDANKLVSEGMSLLSTYCYKKDALRNVGYEFLDVNGDGVCELLIGAIAGDEFVDKAIFELYTLSNDIPVQVFTGEERDRYYICREEAGGYIFANEAASGADQSAWYFYILDRMKLNVIQAIIFDGVADSRNPWFMAYDKDWDVRNDNPISEKLAKDIIESYETRYMQLEYIPFSSYNKSTD